MFLLKPVRRDDDAGFSLVEVMVAIGLATMLGTLLLGMVLATQKQLRTYQVQTDAGRESVAFDAAFASGFNTAKTVNLIGSTPPAAASERNQLQYNFTDNTGACAVMNITRHVGKPYPTAPAPIDYMKWETGYWLKTGVKVAGCTPAALTGATVPSYPTSGWQARPVTFTFFDALGVDITSLTHTGVSVPTDPDGDALVNARIAKVSYTRQRNDGAASTITSTYAIIQPGSPAAAVSGKCTIPDTDWVALPVTQGTTVAGNPAQYRAFGGRLQLRGAIYGGAVSGKLPPDFWPVSSNAQRGQYSLQVKRNGDVQTGSSWPQANQSIDGSFPLICDNTIPDTGWLPLPITSGTSVAGNPAQYRAFRGSLQFKGAINGGNSVSGRVPEDYWPAGDFGGEGGSTGQFMGRNGVVRYATGTSYALDITIEGAYPLVGTLYNVYNNPTY